MRQITALCYIVFLPVIIFAQNKEFDKETIPDKVKLKTAIREIRLGDLSFNSGLYAGFSQALPHYLAASEINPDNRELNKKIGKCLLYSH
ncbi:MAG: hypothetical protein KJ607_01535, partial [Bacteroidetes bacterium]|nr:hypothetical protein [Bacteroidota bacterium]